MYIPKNLEVKDPLIISELIAENGFGTLISADLTATHLPLIYEPNDEGFGLLFGHFAKSNLHWQIAENQRVLVIFQGPHAYISPSWYVTKPAVPTWNYSAVHCYGYLTILDDNENQQAMADLIVKYEPELLNNPEIMPADYQLKLRNGVVGFKIVIDEIQAKEKLGQHRKLEDQKGVFAGLQKSTDLNAVGLCAYMEKRNVGKGS
ncbi:MULTISPECIES: FMN-binding negative transcriptional regulator [Shewanella]|uniref:FMN-binding negative transcriptional regulator n=1 Tax=Shewanella subflava TaxID=2986476 RepID=A0ABT3I4Z0_9GAMM|nr:MULTISPECIES: FMN-binding negative transcriptional regulator [Shewanella]MCL1115286.1 FMN-binding negative transcriptional regulator [Shewanella basaltis]MCW3171136.1 FMN-binding negative transcriptional regulator [Shewanella subflava]